MASLSILDCGAATEQGSRPHQEDRYICIQPQDLIGDTEDRVGFFAVYDGHGGPDISNHASSNLHLSLVASPAFQAGNYEEAIRDAISYEEKLLHEGFVQGANQAATSGSTVALALVDVKNGELVIANLGDSHIVLGEQGRTKDGFLYRPKRLTKADDPNAPGERERVENAGGSVRQIAGQARIGTINMSRALGDFQYKKPLVTGEATADLISSQPHILRYTPDPNVLSVLVIATDGIWTAVEDDSLFEFIGKLTEHGEGAGSIAEKIVQKCASRKHSDNATCIVLFLGSKDMKSTSQHSSEAMAGLPAGRGCAP